MPWSLRRAGHCGGIVFATHYPFLNLPGMYFCPDAPGTQLCDRPGRCQKLDGVYYGVDEEGRLVHAQRRGISPPGRRQPPHGGQTDPGKYAPSPMRAKNSGRRAGEAARWSAQDCMTLDGVPYIGQFAESTPNWYVAHRVLENGGMTHSMVAGPTDFRPDSRPGKPRIGRFPPAVHPRRLG